MKIIAFIVSFIFLSLGVAHLFIDKFTVDTIALALLVLATLPGCSEPICSRRAIRNN
jgi:hypothetical protein